MMKILRNILLTGAISAVLTPVLAQQNMKGMNKNDKMQIEVWSDVSCPFCYIGKHKYEEALRQFEHKDKVKLTWKSFQLAPHLGSTTDRNIYQYLSEDKGVSMEQAHAMTENVVQMGKSVGLIFKFDEAKPVSTFDAHRVLHMAHKQGKQGEMKERLFVAYFVEGKNIADHSTLALLAGEVGLNTEDVLKMLGSDQYDDEVRYDLFEARQLRINGVPFFVFNRKYGISGAQDSKVFLETLEKAYNEWMQEQPDNEMEVVNGAACNTEGDCE